MQNETAGTAFLQYGSVYKNMKEELRQSLVCQPRRITAQRYESQFLCFDCDVYLEIQSGIGVLLVSHDPRNKPIEEFGMNRRIHIKPNVYFGVVSNTPELLLDLLIPQDYSMDMVSLTMPYEYEPVLPRIQVTNIMGCFYRIRTPGYRFRGESHNFFELTYVDTGSLFTEVDGKSYQLREKEIMIYGPGQHHSQHTSEDHSVSYVTIMFNMVNLARDAKEDWYQVLTNKAFPYHKKTYSLIKTLVQESAAGIPYTESLMNCLLTETIIRLLQAEYVAPSVHASSVVRQNYQDELFNRIVAYIESRIYEPLTVAEICQQFSLSRSSLQLLFKSAVNQSPKRYISDLKLEKSCQMLRENKYTISEISLKLGYSSIHYFSNAFNQKYHISPSEYAKRIY